MTPTDEIALVTVEEFPFTHLIALSDRRGLFDLAALSTFQQARNVALVGARW